MSKQAIQKKEDDDRIYIVKEKSRFPKPSESIGSLIDPHEIQYARVVPYHSEATSAFYRGLSRRKVFRGLLELTLEIDTGLTLSYKGKEWRQEESLNLYLRPEDAEAVAKGILATIERGKKKRAKAIPA